jgi:recombination protein RecA
MRRVGAIKHGGEVIGNRTRVRVKKNKVAPPFQKTEFDIMYNEGISLEGDLLDMAVELEVVEKSGAYYSFGETRLGHGRENAKVFLRENVEVANEIEARIREQALLPNPMDSVTGEDNEAKEAKEASPVSGEASS